MFFGVTGAACLFVACLSLLIQKRKWDSEEEQLGRLAVAGYLLVWSLVFFLVAQERVSSNVKYSAEYSIGFLVGTSYYDVLIEDRR